MKLTWWGGLLILGLIGGCQSAKPSGEKVLINRVVSGNTIEWTDSSQQPPQIMRGRLIGIMAPKTSQQPWGTQAKERLENLLLNNPEVRVEIDRLDQDQFSQKLVYVWDKNILINELMLKEGLAISKPFAPNLKYNDRLSNAQYYGRTMGRGIWDINQPLRAMNSE